MALVEESARRTRARPASSTRSWCRSIVFFNIFALNQWLQYRAWGRWADYLCGENVYIMMIMAHNMSVRRKQIPATSALLREVLTH